MSFFVTGTDTGVGKTYLVGQLLRLLRATGLRCAGFKPICCGDRQDAELLLAASSEGFTIDEINPLWLRTPAAPFAAALVEQVDIETNLLLDRFEEIKKRVDLLLVEGVGGWLVPIRKDYFVSDLAAEMKVPVLLVVQNKLGCLNHSLLTLQSIAMKNLATVGLVLNPITDDSNIASVTNAEVLAKVIEIPILPMPMAESTALSPAWSQILGLEAVF